MVFVFLYKLKVCGTRAASKSPSTIFPIAFVTCESVSLVIPQ